MIGIMRVDGKIILLRKDPDSHPKLYDWRFRPVAAWSSWKRVKWSVSGEDFRKELTAVVDGVRRLSKRVTFAVFISLLCG